MKKYLVVAPGYPSQESLYNNYFVHSRLKKYQDLNLKFDVFNVTKSNFNSYVYDGIKVHAGNKKELYKFLNNKQYDKILIHFGWATIINTIVKACPNTPLIIWIHGVDSIGWYRRLFEFNFKEFYKFFSYILKNTRQLFFMYRFIRNNKINKTFVFVSNWIKNITEKDSLSIGKIKNFEIIPNVVDEEVFPYKLKKPSDRTKIISIRPYGSKKYANDLAVKTVIELSKKPFFNKLSFTFYGNGKLFDETLEPLKKFKNVKLIRKFLNHDQIRKVHSENGIMLIPTRQDTHGVSMCEAMSSGLVPVTSNNSAIPEYLNANCGYLTNNYKQLADAIEELYNNPDKFLKMSSEASKFIQGICATKIVIKKEIDLITR